MAFQIDALWALRTMKNFIKLSVLLLPVLLLMGFSPATFSIECDIAVKGAIEVASDALSRTIINNKGKVQPPANLHGSPESQYAWYWIDSTGFRWFYNAGKIHLKGYSLVAPGCSRERADKRTVEILQKLVAQASLESGIEMQILEIRLGARRP